MKTPLMVCILAVLLCLSQAKAGFFSNDGILTDGIECRVIGNSEYELVLARLHIDIWYGHNDVDLFHPVVALSTNANQTIQLDISSDGTNHRVKIPALDIPLPEKCPQPDYEKETLRQITFEMRLYFRDQTGHFEQVRVSPKTMDTKKQIKFARSKKLTKKLEAIFGSMTVDLVNNEYAIGSPNDGAIYPVVIKDQAVLSELEQMARASQLHDF